jgi:hypothetical protein
MPGANPVRGGFDSHTFPPNLEGSGTLILEARLYARSVILAAGFLLFTASGWAQAGSAADVDELFSQASPDSVPPAPVPRVAPADSTVPVVGPSAASDTLRAPLRLRRRTEGKRSAVWWVTVRSGILPGWGQLANRKPVKAAILAGVYTGWAVGALMAESDRRDIDERLNGGDDPDLVAELNDAVDRRNFRMWMMGATMIYAMLDAYVDAHFRGYDETWSFGITPDEPGLAMTVRF